MFLDCVKDFEHRYNNEKDYDYTTQYEMCKECINGYELDNAITKISGLIFDKPLCEETIVPFTDEQKLYISLKKLIINNKDYFNNYYTEPIF
jgi:hypothetical protein